MIEWLDDFYGSEDMRASLLAALGPVFSAYAGDVWKAEGGSGAPPEPFVAGLVSAYVSHHLESSRAQLQEVIKAADDPITALTTRLDEWAEKRPSKVALNELVRTANALALERMRVSNVTRKVWQSSGGSCPYCQGLNGKVVEIEQSFFTPDDTYQPEGADAPLTFSSSIGHPPVHQGCDCSIVAG